MSWVAAMTKADGELPRFDRPPINEVALSVQFESLAGMTAAHIGLAWRDFRDRFPRIEQHPPISYLIERKGLRPALATPQLELIRGGLTPRIWMLNDAGLELIQIQPDHFVRNWRRLATSATYPHYAEHLRPSFMADYELFRQFVQKEKLGDLKIDQCEVTYVNHIWPSGVWENHGQADRVFRGWSKSFCDAVEGHAAESVGIRTRHVLEDSSGEFVGRLLVDIDSAFRTEDQNDPKPVFTMQLVARGRPMGDGIDGVMNFFDMGRKSIVRSFTNLTTTAMHKVWGRTV